MFAFCSPIPAFSRLATGQTLTPRLQKPYNKGRRKASQANGVPGREGRQTAMAVFTIAGLTLKEAVRRRTLWGALLMGLLVLGLSLLLLRIRVSLQHAMVVRHRDLAWFATEYALATSFIATFCLSAIKSLSALFAILLAGGAVSSEIERGLLAVILPKPITRWQVLLGKWIGLNVILCGSVLVWTAMVWASLSWQTHRDLMPLLDAGVYLCLFPVLVSTLALTLSTFAPRLFGTSLAFTLGAFAWFDGIFYALGNTFDVHSLRVLARFAGLVVPQGYVGWWVEGLTEQVIMTPPQRFTWSSPLFLRQWGADHLNFAHLDAVYVALYIVAVFLLGALIFQRRDIPA